MDSSQVTPVRRLGKEIWERTAAAVLLVPLSPLLAVCAVAIKLEGLVDAEARGPVFFAEDRISQGRVIKLLKFRTLTRSALDSLGEGPTHIATLEKAGQVTRAGRAIRQWYLDELPQLLNVVKGDMGLVGTRPYPIELYEEELARGITRKRDMPAGLVGPVQAAKGNPDRPAGITLDEQYWQAYRTWPWWRLLALDAHILWESLKTQLRHEGI